jgi:hypothetical protein
MILVKGPARVRSPSKVTVVVGCFCDTDKAIRRDIVRIMTPLRPPSSSLEELVTHADLLRAADQDFLVANFQLFGLGEDIDFL